jgi:hypothetical protein
VFLKKNVLPAKFVKEKSIFEEKCRLRKSSLLLSPAVAAARSMREKRRGCMAPWQDYQVTGTLTGG